MQSNSPWALEYRGQEYPILSQGLRLGRGQESDVAIQDDQVSRRHATVWDAQGVVFIRDEGSTNGTYVNGKRISAPAPLRPGDRVQVGNSVLSIRATASRMQPEYRGAGSSGNQTGIIIAMVIGLLVLLFGGLAIVIALGAQSNQSSLSQVSSPTRDLGARLPTFPPLPTVLPNTPNAVAPLPVKPDLRRAAMATVMVLMPTTKTNEYVKGSGSIVDKRGVILTNYHVVRDTQTKRPYNNEDLVFVAINSTTDRPPDRIFRAQVVADDSELDLAVLKLVATEDNKPLSGDLKLEVIPIANSDTIQIGDRIEVIGFPSVGGNTVTLSEGIVSGFLKNRAWIKTDSEVNRGNSGGMALNATGELIGVPTEVLSDPEVTGKIGLIRPINLAKPLIARAQ